MQRTINSPGVQIFERDRSIVAQPNAGTNIFVAGFTPQGPTDEVIKITTRDELDSIYGTPTNSAERYFYYSVRELLNSPASIYTFRLPYGAGKGEGFNDSYTALVYPVVAAEPTAVTTTRNLDLSAATYFLGEPYQVSLTPSEYTSVVEGSLFDWTSTATPLSTFETGVKSAVLSALGGAGLIILDKAQTSINSQFEGYYIGIADNVNNDPSSNFDAITKAFTTSLTGNVIGTTTLDYTQIPDTTLQFNLSATVNGASNSISQIMENLTDYDISGREDDDLLHIGVFKLRKSVYANESFKLDFVLDEGIVGSIDSFRKQLNPFGGPSVPFFLEAQDTNSKNIEVLVNPFISNKFRQSSLNSNGIPLKKIRVVTNNLLTTSFSNISAAVGTTVNILSTLNTSVKTADALFPLGSYNPVLITQKIIGSLPDKLDRALESVKNDEVYDIDIVAEAGLGSVYAISQASGNSYYDDTVYTKTLKDKVDLLRTSSELTGAGTTIRNDYRAIFSKFNNFCDPSNGGRGDCMFIADPIRHIVVTGKNNKIMDDKTRIFQKDIYWAMRHQFELENTSYGAGYGNWVQVYDEFSGEKSWVPFSSYQAAIFARSDFSDFPWSAAAGYNRGLVTNALDIAINPNQKQRDELYKININPVIFSPSQGIVVFGQKTLSRKPSAFDRINVRRLFLALERPTKKSTQFFVFEPNNEFTRTRLVNNLRPIFETAKQNSGCADYLIVCDERNNTDQVVDNNELKVDILIKPTRTAEFILCSFTATRTDAVFAELI